MVAAEPAPVEELVLLWPRGSGLLPPVQDHFPPGTKAVWEDYDRRGTTRRVRLRAISAEDLSTWLALPRWLNAVQTELEGVSDQLIHHFVAEHTVALLHLVDPGSMPP
jgi:hypothetical protein